MRCFPASRRWFQLLAVLLLSLPLAAQVNFLTALHFPTGNGPRNVIAADVNGDGKSDLVSCNTGDGTVSVLLGNGDGTFQPPVAYSVAEVNAIAVGDFNGDGKLDIAATNGGGAGTPKQVSILLGNGDGTFQAAVNYPANNYTVGVVVGDFNGDGKLDIAALATNFSGTNYSGEVDILLGNGDGTFQAPLVTSTGSYGNLLIAADFNHDGKLDLAVTNNNDADVVILLGNGDGTFTTGASYVAGGYAQPGVRWYAFVAADVNLDGKPDLVLTLGGAAAFYVMLGNGDGTFSAPAYYGTAAQPFAPIVADFNGDGKPDVAVTDETSGLVYIFPGNGDGTFQNPIDYVAGLQVEGLAVADFNLDGKLDVATANGASNDTSILLGNGDGTFRAARSFGIGKSSPYAPSITLGDFNGDGKLDVATGVTSLLLGNGDGTFQPPVSVQGGTNGNPIPNGGILAADFNHDGKLDLAITENNNSIYNQLAVILLGNGDGTFQPEKDFITQYLTPFSLATADFNGDGNPDLGVSGTDEGSADIGVGIGDGAGDFTLNAPTYRTGEATLASPVTGDFNGDGKQDFVASFVTSLSLFPGNGDGTFQAPSNLSPTFSNISGLIAADFNGDGFLDLAVVDYVNNSSVTVLLGNGDGTFQSPVLYPVGNAPEAVVSADMNQDGRPDLVVLLSGGSVAVLLGNGDGTFQPAVFFPVPPGVSGVAGISGLAVGDVNGDGLPDIVVASSPNLPADIGFSNSITVLLNRTGITLAKSSVTVSSASNPAALGQTVALTATVALTGGSGTPTGAVTFMNGSTALGTATLSGGAATLSTTALAAGNDSITASYSGDRYFAASTSSPLLQVINATPFTAAPTGGSSATVSAGQAATFTVSFTPATTQSQTVALTCSGAPPMSTCTISPTSIPLSGTTATSATVTVQTAGTGAAAVLPSGPYSQASFSGPGWLAVGLAFVLLLVGCSGRRRRVAAIGMLPVALTMLALLMVGCGGGSSSPVSTQTGTYTVVVTAQSGAFSQNLNLTLTVK